MCCGDCHVVGSDGCLGVRCGDCHVVGCDGCLEVCCGDCHVVGCDLAGCLVYHCC